MSSVCPTYVRADDTDIKFDETNVMDDLKDMTFDGKKFSLDDSILIEKKILKFYLLWSTVTVLTKLNSLIMVCMFIFIILKIYRL